MSPTTTSRRLHNLRRELFCQHYVGTAKGNATRAYIMAGYSAATAESAGPRLLGFVEVSDRIEYLRTEAEKHFRYCRLRVLEFLADLADNGHAPLALRRAAVIDIAHMQGYYRPQPLEVRQSIKASVEQPTRPQISEEARRHLDEIAAEILNVELGPEAFSFPVTVGQVTDAYDEALRQRDTERRLAAEGPDRHKPKE